MIAISKENMLFIRDHMLPTPIKVKLGEFFSDTNLERPDEPSKKNGGGGVSFRWNCQEVHWDEMRQFKGVV